MLSNVGHTIQKLINNTPVAVTSNDTTTSVVTNGGNLYQSGLVGSHFKQTFEESFSSENIVGKVLDAEAVENKVYLLNSTGSVFSYGSGKNCHDSIVREIYSPDACGGDKAISISSGRDHVLILTEDHKVWGAGSNEQYQLVPQGQCRYDTAVEILVTDTNLHDNDSCDSFTGIYNELKRPILPKLHNQANDVACLKNTLCDTLLGYINISDTVVDPPNTTGIFSVPVYGDISYVGFLCIDDCDCVSGTLTWTITRLYIKCGCFTSRFTVQNLEECLVYEFNTSSTDEIVLFSAVGGQRANTNLCCPPIDSPLTGTSQIAGKCGDCTVVNIDLSTEIPLPTVTSSTECQAIVLTLGEESTSITALCDTTLVSVGSASTTELLLDVDVLIDCHRREKDVIENLPQPCWTGIFAGYNISVLRDNCNRLYVLGSLHEVRSNRDLLGGSCIQDLINRTSASVSFPADQLNKPHRDNCSDNRCGDYETDLSKFGVHLNFHGQDKCHKGGMNVCEFLEQLKHCTENKQSGSICEPCDGYVHLNVACSNTCGVITPTIGSVTLLNKKSITKLVSQCKSDVKCLHADLNTIVEFDLNGYCIDAIDVSLDKIVKLQLCQEGPNVNIYLDIDQPGGVKLSRDHDYNVEFPIDASTKNHQFLLNYGSILDPVELTNLKYALSLDCYYPSSQYKNPFDTKITNVYLRGGDRVRFIGGNPKNVRLAITADIPTVFRLNRRVIDVAVGHNNLTVLAGGLSCPNELFAIGVNCHGELGLGNCENVVCFKKVNRCNFDCQVSNVFAGNHVTFYGTQSHHLYAAGQWKDIINSNTPQLVRSICQTWKIKQVSISSTHIILLGTDGCIFGLGDNKMGELGLKHTDPIHKPYPLSFFYQLDNRIADKLGKCFDRSCNLGRFDCNKDSCDRDEPVWKCEIGNPNQDQAQSRCPFNGRFPPRACNQYRPNSRIRPSNKW